MSLIKDYFKKTKELNEKYGEKSIVLMQVGSFFEVYGYKKSNGDIYGSQIDCFRKICEFNVSEKKNAKGNEDDDIIMMAGFPEYQIEKYIDKLQLNGFTVAIYKQHEEEKQITRKLDVIVSPGTHFNVEQQVISNYIVCLRIFIRPVSSYNPISKVIFGLSALDILTGQCNYSQHCEVYNHNPSTYDFVERYISIYKPNEIVILHQSTLLSKKELDDVKSYISIHNIHCHLIDMDNTEHPFSKSANITDKQTFQKDILQTFYPEEDMDIFFQSHLFYENSIACHVFVFMLEFVSAHNKNICIKLKYPNQEYNDKQLHLANHSLKQLNILPDERYQGKKGSIVEFMNHCHTSMGKRKLRHRILHPITNKNILNNMYNRIEYFVHNETCMDSIRRLLTGIIDIEREMRRMLLNKYTINDLVSFYKSCLSMREIFTYLSQKEDVKDIEKLFEYSFDDYSIRLSYVIKKIEELFNVNTYVDISNNILQPNDNEHIYTSNILNRQLYKDLDNAERKYIEYHRMIYTLRDYFSLHIFLEGKSKKEILSVIHNNHDYNRILSKVVQSRSGHLCKIHETDKSGIYFKATKSRIKQLKKSFPLSYVDTESKTKNKREITIRDDVNANNNDIIPYDDISEIFEIENELETPICTTNEQKITNDSIQNIINKYGIYKDEFEKQTQVYFRKAIESICEYTEDIIFLSDMISDLDVITSHAYHSIKYKYCKPIIEDNIQDKEHEHEPQSISSFLEAENMRHPLIEVIQTQETFVANDISLGKNENGILLFGTNAVGKSSLIKAIGMCIIMAQSGCYVPCSKFKFSPYYKLFTRILGNDNIFKGLSTFAVEMSELNVILRQSDRNSLVLGDELCSGTEMGSAISIFAAGIKYLSEKQSSFMFATHFHQIVDMEEIRKLKNVVNKHLSVTYEPERDILVYNRKLQDGPGNNIYGLEVCKSLKLPETFLESANEIRLKQFPKEMNMSSNEKTYYNKHKMKSNCEICNVEIGIDTHHLLHQKYSDNKGYIQHIHKNHKANLMNLCKECHDRFHREFKDVLYRRTKTSKGMKLMEVEIEI